MSEKIERIYVLIGARIEQIRGVLGVTQEELATRTGYSRPSIANIELGRQRIYIHQIDNVAAALGTTSKNLMKGIWL